MRGGSEAPKKALVVGLIITIIMLIIFLISIRIIPAPTPAEILTWIIEFTSIFFMAILGGILVGMYLYHTIWYHGEPEPWEETIYRIYSKLEDLEKKIEELEEKIKKIEEKQEKEGREVFYFRCPSYSLYDFL